MAIVKNDLIKSLDTVDLTYKKYLKHCNKMYDFSSCPFNTNKGILLDEVRHNR